MYMISVLHATPSVISLVGGVEGGKEKTRAFGGDQRTGKDRTVVGDHDRVFRFMEDMNAFFRQMRLSFSLPTHSKTYISPY